MRGLTPHLAVAHCPSMTKQQARDYLKARADGRAYGTDTAGRVWICKEGMEPAQHARYVSPPFRVAELDAALRDTAGPMGGWFAPREGSDT